MHDNDQRCLDYQCRCGCLDRHHWQGDTAPAGTWTIIAWLQPEDQGLASSPAPARVLYVRDSSGKWSASTRSLRPLTAARFSGCMFCLRPGHHERITAAQTSWLIPFLESSTTEQFHLLRRTTYNAATTTGANNYGGGNCERLSFESATAFIGTPAAVGWGLDAHSGGTATNAVTALDWQVTN